MNQVCSAGAPPSRGALAPAARRADPKIDLRAGRRTAAVVLVGLIGATSQWACSPALDWREARTDDGLLAAQFPCRPQRHERTVTLVGASAPMQMMVCKADGVSFALTTTTLNDPRLVTAALDALQAAAVTNLGAREPQVTVWQVAGMTPNPRAARLGLNGSLPDGTPAREEAVFFVRGLKLHQATMLGAGWSPAAAESFFGGLRFLS